MKYQILLMLTVFLFSACAPTGPGSPAQLTASAATRVAQVTGLAASSSTREAAVEQTRTAQPATSTPIPEPTADACALQDPKQAFRITVERNDILYLVNLDGSLVELAPADGNQAANVRWSDDLSRVAIQTGNGTFIWQAESGPVEVASWALANAEASGKPVYTVQYEQGNPEATLLQSNPDGSENRLSSITFPAGLQAMFFTLLESPNGQYWLLSVVGGNGTGLTFQQTYGQLYLLDTVAGAIFTIPSDGVNVRSVAWSPDSKAIFSASGYIYNLKTAQAVVFSVPGGVSGWAWQPDSSAIAVFGDGVAFVDVETGRVTTLSEPILIQDVVWLNNNELLAIPVELSKSQGSYYVFSAGGQASLMPVDIPGGADYMMVTADGKYLFAGNGSDAQNQVYLIDLFTGLPAAIPAGYSPDERNRLTRSDFVTVFDAGRIPYILKTCNLEIIPTGLAADERWQVTYQP